MWSHDAGTNTVIVYYMGEDRASEKPDYFETVDGKNIQHLRITLPDNDGHTVPRSDTTANDVTQTLQALVNSKTTESNKFKWKLFTIAFKTITESGEKVWRTDGTDNVELAKDFKAFIFNNKVGETGSLQDRSSICMPLCRTSFSSTRIQNPYWFEIF
eukprot:GHVU01025910.1.p1 GENE.GHVU01025910.1~~GHVU01025910.1.p1  ORF type:complete len:158 (+),score=19.86 GHVU01025910.1:165-638(+)